MKYKDPEDSKYKFNAHGVCTNPDSLVSHAGKVFSYEITVGKNPMGWDAGYRYQFKYGPADLFSIGTSGVFRYQACQKKEVAIIDKIVFILEQIEVVITETASLKKWLFEIDPLLELLASFDPEHYQIQHFKKYTMAKTTTKETPLGKGIKKLLSDTTASPPAETKVINLSLTLISESKHNPRKAFDKDYIKELSESIAGPAGLLSPIIVRPVTDDVEYEIVAGACRYRAVKLLKWDTIPAVVKNISDEELLEVMIIENLNRKDISPIEEAVAFKTLLQKESIDWLASKVHKPKKYILDRLKLNDLIKEGIELVKKGTLPLGHAVAIAKLPYADQQKCLDKCIENGFGENTDDDYCKVPLEELKDFISDEIMTDFSKVNFNPDDDTLYPTAGSCTTCPKRTCNNNLLFHDITKEDKCTDAACFHEKINLHIAREKEINKEKYGKVLSGEKDPWNSGYVKVQGVTVRYSEAPTKNTVPVVISKTERHNKDTLGKTVYIDSKVLEATKTEKADKKTSPTNSRSTWEAYIKNEFIKKHWPMLQLVAKNDHPNDRLIKETLMELFDRKSRFFMSFAGILGLNGFAQDAEKAYDNYKDGYHYGFRREMYEQIMNRYDPETLLTMYALISAIDHHDDEQEEDEEEEEFGLSWKKMMTILGIEKPPAPKKAAAKKK